MKKYAFILLSLLFSIIFISKLTAEIPKRINFQAYLIDADAIPLNRNVNLIVKLFDGEYSNNALYVNSSSDRNVKVENGFLNYYINDLYDEIFDNQLWAELTVDGVILDERIPLASSPYSFNSLKSNKAKLADTATFAKGLSHNSVTNNHIVDGAIKGINIENNQISSNKLVLDDGYDWKGVHTYTSTGVDMELNRNGYAINVVKGSVKMSVMELDTLNTEYIVSNTISTSEVIMDDYIIKSDNNGLFIGLNGTASISGLIFKDAILRYIQTPTFNNNSDNNSIITKKYLDDNINDLKTLIDGAKDITNDLVNTLLPNKLVFWNGNNFANSPLELSNNNKISYFQHPTYTDADELVLTSKSYVDTAIKNVVNFINNGMYNNLTTNYITKWDGAMMQFANSSIAENTNKDTLLLGINNSTGLIKVGDISFRITPSGTSHYTDIFDVNHLHSIGISANVIESSSILTDNARYFSSVTSATDFLPFINNELTFASKGYVDYSRDTLKNYLQDKIDNDFIDGSRIINNTITSDKIESLDGSKIWTGTITGGEYGQIASKTIKSGNIDDWAIQTRHIENESVITSKLADGSVTTAKLNDESVITSKLADGSVTNPKIADNSVTTTKIADNSVTTTKIADNSVTTTKIADNSVTTNKINDGSVTNSKLNVSKIDYIGNTTDDFMPIESTPSTLTTMGYVDAIYNDIEYKIGEIIEELSNDIHGSRIINYTITEQKLNANSISTRTIQNLAISNEKIANGAITNDKISTNSVDRRTILDGEIITEKIANGNVINSKIGDNAVDTRTITDNAITESKIKDKAVTNSKLEVSKIVYEGNHPDDYYMPQRRLSDDLWDDSILTTHSLVNAYYNEALDYTNSLSFHLFNVHKWGAISIAPNSINDYHLVAGSVRNQHLFVDNIEYQNNSDANYYMPTTATNRTLTTKRYVDNTIKDNIRNMATNDANPTITLKNNISSTAIKVETGNIVLSYIDVPVGNVTTHTDLEGYGNYSVININSNIFALYNQVYLPRTGIQPGQILNISNSTNISSLDTYNGNPMTPEIIPGGSITNGRAVSFIAINTPSGIKWVRLN